MSTDRRVRLGSVVRRGLLVVAVLMVPVAWSYLRALTGPGNDSAAARTVEWARDHHLGSIVDIVERRWYSHHQAKIGGDPAAGATQLSIAPVTTPPTSAARNVAPGTTSPTPATSSPSAIPTSPSTTTVPNGPINPPAALLSPAPQPVPGEGAWAGIGAPGADGRYGMYATTIRPDSVHTSILDAVLYVDPTRVRLRAYPGVRIPGGPWDRPMAVEAERQPGLLAAFNGGFRLADSKGGMMLGGRVLQAMRDGGATLAIDRNGVANIGAWGTEVVDDGQLDSARQNLDLIVDNGQVNPDLANDPNRKWGFTGPANRDAVWRSAAGITADGALVWVCGDGLTIQSLADSLVRAGAVRGMQMDINREWVQFNTYSTRADGTVHGVLMLRGMAHSGDRYLSTDSRDFIAAFVR